MANNTNAVDAVVAQEAIKQVENLISKLSLADAELIKISESALKAGKGISAISTPSGMDKAVSNTTALNAELAKQNKIINGLQSQITKLSQVRAINNKMSAEEAVNQRILNQNALTQAKSVSNLVGEYDKLNIKHQQALKNAQNIGAQYGATSKQFLEASAKANVLDERLKSLDATLGKNTRNVGNYPGKFNALGNSISQLSREMPAFANSAQTGFMAISNNIPAFQDAITQMRSGGASWKEVLKGIGSSLFGLTGIISIATTALVVLGPKLIDWITNTDKEKEATDRLVASMKKQNEELRIYNDNIAHQSVLSIENAKQRGAAASEIDSLERKGVEDQLKNFERVRDARKKDLEDFAAVQARKNLGYFASPIGYAQRLQAEKERIKNESSLQKNALIEAENAVKKQGFVLSELIEKQQTQRYESAVAAAKKIKKIDPTPKIEGLESFLKQGKPLIIEIDEMMSRLNVERIVASEEGRVEVDAMISKLKDLKAALTGGLPTAPGTILNPIKPEAIEKVKEMSEAMKNYLSSFVTDFASNSGFTNLISSLDPDDPDSLYNKIKEGNAFSKENWKSTTVDIMESAQEMYNFLNQNSEANFNAEKNRLQSQYDVSLKYAGDNKAAQEKLALDLEAKKKDIANREAKAKQKQAIFNIAIDTAQAIISLWAKPGFPAAIPLAIAVGALGAAQIGMVASQEIPQYWMGGTHDGGLMMVNDGLGSNYKETIVTPDGKIMKPQGRNVLMDAPAGTEIFTPEQWREKQLSMMLNEKGISMSNSNQYNGITKSDLYDVMSDTLGSQPQYHSNFDANGATDYIIKGGNKTILRNNRGNGRGSKF